MSLTRGTAGLGSARVPRAGCGLPLRNLIERGRFSFAHWPALPTIGRQFS